MDYRSSIFWEDQIRLQSEGDRLACYKTFTRALAVPQKNYNDLSAKFLSFLNSSSAEDISAIHKATFSDTKPSDAT